MCPRPLLPHSQSEEHQTSFYTGHPEARCATLEKRSTSAQNKFSPVQDMIQTSCVTLGKPSTLSEFKAPPDQNAGLNGCDAFSN